MFAALTDRLIRRKIQAHKLDLGRYTVRVAKTREDYLAAGTLIQRCYKRRGYVQAEADIRVTPHQLLHESVVLVALYDDEVIGTMTVTLDSESGLPVDATFPQETEGLRNDNAVLVELNSLAIQREHRRTGVSLMLYMAAYQMAYRSWGASHFVMTCHPKAEMVYRAMFGFRRHGAVRQVNGLAAPAIVLSLDLFAARAFMRRHFKKPMPDGRSLLDTFLNPQENVEVPHHMPLPALLEWRLTPHLFLELSSYATHQAQGWSTTRQALFAQTFQVAV